MNRMMKAISLNAKIVVILALLLSGVHLFAKKAAAAEFNLPLNTNVKGVLTKNITSNTYTVELNKAGRFFLNVTSYVDSDTYIRLLDDENDVVFDDYTSGSSESPAKYTNWVDLEPGKYFVEIYNKYDWDENIGNYTLKATFTAANNNEVEQNNGTVNAQPLKFNQAVTGFLSWNDEVDFYKVTLPKAGRFHIDLNTYIDSNTYIKLLDNNNETVFDHYTEGSSKNPAKYYNWVDLEPGDYYLEVYNKYDWDDNTGKYILKTSFTPANNNEKESNNGTIEAQALPFSQTVTGFLSWNDTIDYYKFTLPKSGKVTFNSVSYVDETTFFQLINSQNDELLSDYVEGSSKNPAKYSKTIELKKGTYFFKVYNKYDWDDNTGKYTLKITSPVVLAPLTVDKVSDKSTVIKGKTAKNQEVIVKASGKTYKKKANSVGAFSINIPKQKAGTKIEVSAKNKYGTKKVSITVLDKTPPKTPTIKKATVTYVEGKGEKASTIYVYKGSKLVGKATVGKKGTFKAKISKQKKGSKLVVYAKNKAGNKSGSKTVKVK
ncbi:hypothetical protein B5V89_05415 [Heyndrickxia sporothermodurans]|uniref:Ig-like domain-containing protein n=1 Tax=Heyndrickxia sporothermodurans TaxID=46224 RepID=UPI000D346549|nr:Ig-like domain-containing protein [Heyndrickxia sporothermodurans]PTY79407.1 hypothetical protein B5V89_05415 [Heyndrickxia sporothermodurans]